MTASSDIRRHPDGSIDFDHYRRAAAHERQQALAPRLPSLPRRVFQARQRYPIRAGVFCSQLRQRPVHARVNTDAFTNQPSR